MSKYGVFSGPYFPAFGLNTERYGVSLRIQSECGKIRTGKNFARLRSKTQTYQKKLRIWTRFTQWTETKFFLLLNMFHHAFRTWWISFRKIDHSCTKLVLIKINKNMFFFIEMPRLWTLLHWGYKESPCSKMLLLCNYYVIYEVKKYVMQANS